jgi:hypothetical protein
LTLWDIGIAQQYQLEGEANNLADALPGERYLSVRPEKEAGLPMAMQLLA